MTKLTIDGKEVEVPVGTTIIEAAKKIGKEIPHYCYHPKLSIAGNCRMCLVEVEKMAKPAISCQMTVTEGMVVHTDNDNVKALRKNVLEFILVNHPIDCPVCDQAGECKLQEYYMSHSLTESHMTETKVHKPKRVDLGKNVMLDAERCILCSRCIRFCDEISESKELCFSQRGDHETLTTFPGMKLDNPYSLNTVDLCPVGALTNKDFRFECRVWFLQETASVCTGCATGCNIRINHHDGKVYRYLPRENDAVNECWLCDEGRLSYPYINENRLFRPFVMEAGKKKFISPHIACELIAAKINQVGKQNVIWVGSAFESNENNAALKKFAQDNGATQIYYSENKINNAFSDDYLIKADKNPNRAGVEVLGFQPFASVGNLQGKLVLFINERGDAVAKAKASGATCVVLASNEHESLASADIVVPVFTFAEQKGSFTNDQKRVQKFDAALIGSSSDLASKASERGRLHPALPVEGATLAPLKRVHGDAKAVWLWLRDIARLLGTAWQENSEEDFFKNIFKISYNELPTEGKIFS